MLVAFLSFLTVVLGIYEFHRVGIIRVGGRSNSEIMNECNLRTLKRKNKENKTTSREVRQAFYDVHRELDKINDEMQQVTECLKQCSENVVHENELRESNIMTEEQFCSLRSRFDVSISTKASALLKWLNLNDTGMDLQDMSKSISHKKAYTLIFKQIVIRSETLLQVFEI